MESRKSEARFICASWDKVRPVVFSLLDDDDNDESERYNVIGCCSR